MDDLISRQAAIDAIMCEPTDAHYPSWYAERLEQLPSAQPERKKGKWIDETLKPWGLVYHPYKCDQCGEHSEADSNFFPNCGAEMEEGK